MTKLTSEQRQRIAFELSDDSQKNIVDGINNNRFGWENVASSRLAMVKTQADHIIAIEVENARLLDYLTSHAAPIRKALDLAYAHASPATIDTDDQGYWLHEIKAFDEIATHPTSQTPDEQEEWDADDDQRDMPGGMP